MGTKINAIEVGVESGENAVNILRSYDDIFLHLVENFSEEYGDGEKHKEALYKNIEPFKNRVELKIMKSVDAAELYPKKTFDYIYIDADHSYKSVTEDLNAWYPKLKYGGIIAGHDWWYEDVRKAVKDFFVDKDGVRLYAVQGFHSYEPSSEEGQFSDWWINGC